MSKFTKMNKKIPTTKKIQKLSHRKIQNQKKQDKKIKKNKRNIKILNDKILSAKRKTQNINKNNVKKQNSNISSSVPISNQKAFQIQIFKNNFKSIPQSLRITVIQIAKGFTLDAVHKDKLNLDLAKFNDQEFVYPHDAHQILKNISQNYHIERIYLQPNYITAINKIKMMEDKTDVFVNLYDLPDQTGHKILEYMENNNIAFTGTGSRMYAPTRQLLKRVCAYSGVPTPQHTFISSKDLQNINQIIKNFKYPLFVKPQLGYDSVGIDKDSVVYNLKDLKKKCKQIIEKHGSAFVEKYVDGRQFSVLIAGNKHENFVFSPVEYIFNQKINQKFITFQDKWGNSTQANWMILDLKNENESIINKKLQFYSKKIFQAFDDNGYTRIDFRQDRITGQLYALDYNSPCSVFYKNDQATADNILRQMGLKKDFFMFILIKNALQRSNQKKESNRSTLMYDQNHKADVVATQSIKKNQVIYTEQMCPLRLVTKSYVQKNWTKKQIDNFNRQAWPVGFNIYAIIDQNLKCWRPLSHSCDPNCWMQGLSVVARKDIKKGQKLTLDYSTFKPSFNIDRCECKSKVCRKIIKPNAHTQRRFQQKYKGHCSPYIQYLIASKKK